MHPSGASQKVLRTPRSGFQEGFSARCSKAGSHAIGPAEQVFLQAAGADLLESSATGHGFSFEGVKGEGRHGRCFEACTPILRLKANCKVTFTGVLHCAMGDAEFEASKRQRAANRQCGPALGGTARLLVFEPGVIGTCPASAE